MKQQRHPFRLALVLVAVLAGTGWVKTLCAAEFHTEGFDDETTSWRVRYNQSEVRLLAHRRNARLFLTGTGAENIEVDAPRQGAIVQFEHALPPSRVIDDLKLTIAAKSNRPGLMVGLRVIFPHQKDPRSGGVLSAIVRGDTYDRPDHWQTLECTTLEKQVREQLILLRAQLRTPDIDTRDSYVDRVILAVQLGAGTTEFFIDELRLGPIVKPLEGAAVVQAGMDEELPIRAVDFSLDRLMVDGRPFLPRIVPYHGEDLQGLADNGVNVVWTPDYRDAQLLAQLHEQGMWALATPPRAVSASGQVLSGSDASLVPFSKETAPILGWYVGTRIPPEARDDLAAWVEQIRSADRRYNRPILGDVTGQERVFSRQLSMTGLSRHILNTGLSFASYHDWLVQKQKICRPGSFAWTWVQTEPSSANVEWRSAAGVSPIVIEPEQIRLQVYAALSAGSRGIGYWKAGPFDPGVPGGRERELAIAQLNLELQILEPWLATGTVIGQIPFETGASTRETSHTAIGFRNANTSQREQEAILNARDIQLKQKSLLGRELEAAIIRSDYGLLLLPAWYEHHAQFVPGQLAANDATIVVPGVDETASAWEVTTTGIRSLTRERVTGGIKITLPKFDQTAAVVLTADRDLISRLRTTVDSTSQRSARVSIDLARAKLDRVRSVNSELDALGISQPDAPQLFARAESMLSRADEAFGRQEYHPARQLSADSMQLLRILQRAHWNHAVHKLASPTTSLHAVCFQTLPDHWQMIRQIGRSQLKVDNNLLRSGDFEDGDTMIAAGWQHEQTEIEGVRATAELYSVSRQGQYSLRLVAVAKTGDEPPRIIEASPVSVTTPPVMVRSGQIVHTSGWARVATPMTAGLDGAILYDNIGGRSAALRWHELQDWKYFDLIRQVQESGDFTIRMSLNGLGEIQFDDLKIVLYDSAETAGTASPKPAEGGSESRPGALEFLQRLPKLRK